MVSLDLDIIQFILPLPVTAIISCQNLNLLVVFDFWAEFAQILIKDALYVILIISIATPGPGSYRMPSEFGYYESRYAKTMDSQDWKTQTKGKNGMFKTAS